MSQTKDDNFFGFLKRAKKQTYASETAKKVTSLRPGSSDSVTEAEIDKSLRGALKVMPEDILPVRGPKRFTVENYIYTNDIEGRIE